MIRLATSGFLGRDAVVHLALEIQRSHRRVSRLIEPAAGAQPPSAAVIRWHQPAFPVGAETVQRHDGCQRPPTGKIMIDLTLSCYLLEPKDTANQ
jgi:hypothetical protein